MTSTIVKVVRKTYLCTQITDSQFANRKFMYL